MIYLKSILVGLVAVLVSAVVVVFVAFVGLAVWRWAHGGNSIDFTLGFSGRSPVNWILPVFIFGAASYWEYRRLSR